MVGWLMNMDLKGCKRKRSSWHFHRGTEEIHEKLVRIVVSKLRSILDISGIEVRRVTA
jgi:hypothetical protein